MSERNWVPDSCVQPSQSCTQISAAHACNIVNGDICHGGVHGERSTMLLQSEVDDLDFHGETSGLDKATNSDSPRVCTANSLGGKHMKKCTQKEVQSEVDMKTKFISAWNNVKHGWAVKMKTHFKNDSPIWLLGQCYICRDAEHGLVKCEDTVTKFEQFKRDFASRIWLTYRQDFPALDGTNFTTDVGWGCMLRTGQMVLAQSLVVHLLGRDWRWYGEQNPFQITKHEQLIRLFGDHPCKASPFSLHILVRMGRLMGKCPPDWYGPASVAHLLRSALVEAREFNHQLSNFTIYVAQDCTVYKHDIEDLSTAGGTEWRNAVLIIIPVRLGGERLNAVYLPCIRGVLSHPLCVGILGGRPKHSLYFVGWQDDKLLYLDPHFSQPTVDVRPANFPQDSYHCMSPRKMAADRIDPSCALAFYCRTRDDFELFMEDLQKLTCPPGEHDLYPMFVFADGRLHDASNEYSDAPEKRLHVVHTDRNGRAKNAKSSDDYVFLG